MTLPHLKSVVQVSLKQTDRGNVTPEVEQLNSLHSSSLSAHPKFSITDTGVGIAPEDIQKLFKAFGQVGDRSRQTKGTGLELANRYQPFLAQVVQLAKQFQSEKIEQLLHQPLTTGTIAH